MASVDEAKGDINGMIFFLYFSCVWGFISVLSSFPFRSIFFFFFFGLYLGFFLNLVIKQFGSIVTGQLNCILRSVHKHI